VEARKAKPASLRSEKAKTVRRGNDAPWKAWKTPKAKTSFPLFPPGLETQQEPERRLSTFPPRRRRFYIKEGEAKVKPKLIYS
jgi:hypothetical protein